MSYSLQEIIDVATVIPVLAVKRIEDAPKLARALANGGLKVIELTLRTPIALDAMKAMQDAAPELIVGMGTVTSPEQAQKSSDEGAAFLVSPGLTTELGQAMLATGTPCLPGVATAGEAMSARAAGFDVLKFFPAEPAGGMDYLKALAGPLPDMRFCPTGGISKTAAPDYLALNNVVCVGGSWMASAAAIEAGKWSEITDNARIAASM